MTARRDVMPSEVAPPLSRQAVNAGVWAIRLRAVERGLAVVRILVLARLVAPEDFGLFGVATLMVASLEVFTQTGFAAALIQRRGEIREYLDVAWTAQAIRGALLAGGAWLLAGPIAGFFDVTEAVPLLRVLGLVFLFQGVTNIGIVNFRRDLELHRQWGYVAAGAVTEVTVAIGIAAFGGGAWSLVIGVVAGHGSRAVASYVVHPYRPRVRLDLGKARELYAFGRWVFASGILIFLVTQGDDAVVGRLLGVTALGWYQMAYLLSNLPATQIAHVLNEVTLPAFARLQDDRVRLTTAYLLSMETVATASFPLAAMLLVAAPEIARGALGPDWVPIAPSLRILAILGVLRALGASNGALVQGAGRPRVDSEIALIHLALMAAFIVPLTRTWGLAGAASAVTLPMLASQAYGFWRVRQVLGVTAADLAGRIAIPVTASALLAVAYAACRVVLDSAVPTLLAGGLLGASIYAALIFAAHRRAARLGRETAVSFLVRALRDRGS
ncbi:MAG TPA: lipopolysaccharide biosynthesis protein [Longimicrobiales bacterium]